MAGRQPTRITTAKVTLDHGQFELAPSDGPSRDYLERLEDAKAARNFGKHTRTRRYHLGHPQADVARLMTGIHNIPWHQTVVAKIESGERAIRADEVFALAHLYDIDLSDLIHGRNLDAPPRWVFAISPAGDEALIAMIDTTKEVSAGSFAKLLDSIPHEKLTRRPRRKRQKGG